MRVILHFSFTLLFLIIISSDLDAQRAGRRRAVVASNSVTHGVEISQSKSLPDSLLLDSVVTRPFKAVKCNFSVPAQISVDTAVGEIVEEISIEEVVMEEEEITCGGVISDQTLIEEIIWPKPNCRETNPVNKSNTADAYPFISADGLRLYFTSNREGGHGRFFISTRSSVKDPFSEPKVLSPNLVDGYYAGTLTADELTLVMVMSGDMYISTRSSVYSNFSTPVAIKGATDQYHFGPSISPDGREIIVMVTVDTKDVIRVYRRTGANSVEMAGELAFPKGIAGPGQFSKDGLSYFFSLENEDKEVLWKYSRLSADHPFADLQELPLQLQSLKNNLQPSVNGDGSILVFVTSPDETWDSDDIVLVNNTKSRFEARETYKNVFANEQQSMTVMNKVVGEGIRVYPNPFQKNIQIELPEHAVEGTVFNLYDISGKKVNYQRLTSMQTQLPLQSLVKGVYIYQVIDNKGRLVGSGKLVKTD